MTDGAPIQPRGPARVGKYHIQNILGEGAMGVVYAGHDPDIDRSVAIKTVHRHLIEAAGSEDWLVRFSREARAAGRVLHPNLVTIFDYLEHDGLPYLVMERVRSMTLEDRLEAQQRADLGVIQSILTQVLDGLACIHEAGIIHRDMKPANVMLTENGGVKLTDFGIARITTMDRTGAGMVGTPAYMSPEQFSGGDVDARADIYATGVVLYEALTGQRPFDGGGIEAVLRASRGQQVTPPSAVLPSLPTALDGVVLRAIAADPKDRFASAQEMRAALVTALQDQKTNIPVNAPRNSPALQVSETMISRLSNATLVGVEKSLVSKIGPIGKVIAKRAASAATNPEELQLLILRELREGHERDEMRSSMEGLLASNAEPASGGISQADMQRVSTMLRPYLGPITTVLVKREAAKAQSVDDLVSALAASIKRSDEKATFIANASDHTEKGMPHV